MTSILELEEIIKCLSDEYYINDEDKKNIYIRFKTFLKF